MDLKVLGQREMIPIINWKVIKHYRPQFRLGGLKYYVITLKWMIWYNALIVYIHVFKIYVNI